MATKKPVKKTKNKDDRILTIQYTVDIPKKELNDLMQHGCGRELSKFAKNFHNVIADIAKDESNKISKEVQ